MSADQGEPQHPSSLNLYREQWISTEDEQRLTWLYQQCLTALTSSPNRVDLLVRVQDLPSEARQDLIARLLTHSKIGTLSIFGLPLAERLPVLAEAILIGVHVRFVDNEEDAQMILSKRRAASVAAHVPDVHPALLDANHTDHVRGTAW